MTSILSQIAKHKLAWTLLSTATFLTGCTGDSDGPKTVNASGVVTLDGVPVEKAQVVFIDDAAKMPAYSPTDKDGKFSLKISEEKKGAVPGSYRVTVSKTIMDQGNGGDVNIKFGLPKKYANMMESGLTFTIPDKGTSDIKLELKSK